MLKHIALAATVAALTSQSAWAGKAEAEKLGQFRIFSLPHFQNQLR